MKKPAAFHTVSVHGYSVVRHMERGSSAVECRTCNLESSGSNTPLRAFATVSKFGQFRSLHNVRIHSDVFE